MIWKMEVEEVDVKSGVHMDVEGGCVVPDYLDNGWDCYYEDYYALLALVKITKNLIIVYRYILYIVIFLVTYLQ